MDFLDQILEQVATAIVTVKEYDGLDYKVNVEKLAITFALNITLVLKGARLAYRSDCLLNSYLLPFIQQIYPSIDIIYEPISEPLVFLSENMSSVLAILMGEERFSTKVGKVLGYHYNGERWAGKHKRYIFHYVARNSEKEHELYGFVCPADEYTDLIREKIQKDRDIYENTLQKYGYTVTVETWIEEEGTELQILDRLI